MAKASTQPMDQLKTPASQTGHAKKMSQNKMFPQDRHQNWVLYQPENMSLSGVKPCSYMEVYGDLCRWPWRFHVGLISQSLSLPVGKVHYIFVCFDNF